MKLTVFVGIYLALFISCVKGQTGCPTNFVELDQAGDCYFFSEDIKLQLAWQEARDYCTSFAGTSTLVTSDLLVLDSTFAEFTAVSTYMISNGLNNTFIGSYELGLTELQWAWVDGSTVELSDPLWDCGYPVNTASQACGILAHDSEPLGSGDSASRMRMEDTSCTDMLHFVCEGQSYSSTNSTAS